MEKLIARIGNGRVKVITGLRRSGKSYLLFRIFKHWLLASGVEPERIIEMALDDFPNARYRNPAELDRFVRDRVKGTEKRFFVFLDEIQFVRPIPNPYFPGSDEKITFVDVVLGLMKLPNADIYITGSNSRMLSSDIVTQFRDRGDEIRVHPCSFSEFAPVFEGDPGLAWAQYWAFGGLPAVIALSSEEEKSDYLKNLFANTYVRDILERHDLRKDRDTIDELLNVVASSIGAPTNPTRIANTFKTAGRCNASPATIASYLGYLEDAFLIEKAQRYDVKGRKYIGSPCKYYFTDVGLRNARLNFRQQEESHAMENAIYMDLRRRGLTVDTGDVPVYGKSPEGKTTLRRLEVDFMVNCGHRRWYIQSALNVDTAEKAKQEAEPLIRSGDSFPKIVVLGKPVVPWHDERGIFYIGIEDFLKDESFFG